MFHHEFLALLRCIPPEKAMMAINALCDIDLGIEPDISDSGVMALVETKRGSVIEEQKKYYSAVERINKARKAKEPQEVKSELNTEISNTNIEISKNNTENNEKNDNINTEINDENSTEIIPSSSSSSSSSNNNDEEFKRASRGKNSLSSSAFDTGSDPPKPERILPEQNFSPGMIYGDAAQIWETIRKEWNSHNCRFTCDKIYLNLSPCLKERVRGSMATYTPDQIVMAIRKYFKEREKNPGGYEYKSFYLFIENGLDFNVEI
jgi:hypothetical protein